MGADVVHNTTRATFWLGLMIILVSSLAAVSSAVAQEDAEDPAQQQGLSECDQFMESYVRSSARKMWRSLSRGGYGLEPMEFDETLVVSSEALGTDEPVEFEVLLEEGTEIVGFVDRERVWNQTYLVVDSIIGPIVASQTWQPRHLRDSGQECEPISSSVERPARIASTVDIEPFRYWGLRISWRVPAPENAEASDKSVEDTLVGVMTEFLKQNR